MWPRFTVFSVESGISVYAGRTKVNVCNKLLMNALVIQLYYTTFAVHIILYYGYTWS